MSDAYPFGFRRDQQAAIRIQSRQLADLTVAERTARLFSAPEERRLKEAGLLVVDQLQYATLAADVRRLAKRAAWHWRWDAVRDGLVIAGVVWLVSCGYLVLAATSRFACLP